MVSPFKGNAHFVENNFIRNYLKNDKKIFKHYFLKCTSGIFTKIIQNPKACVGPEVLGDGRTN
jgi:hypothetical protein